MTPRAAMPPALWRRVYRYASRRAGADGKPGSPREIEELFVDLYQARRSTSGLLSAQWFAFRALVELLRGPRGAPPSRPHPSAPPPRPRQDNMFDDLTQDLRYALRGLAAAPGYAGAVAITIGLAIGVNTAMFSVFNAVLLRPLQYEDPARLAFVWPQLLNRDVTRFAASPIDLRDFREQATQFSSFEGISTGQDTLHSDEGSAMLVGTANVTPGFFRLLGVTPALGRDFRAAAEVPTEGVLDPVLLSHELWRTRFGSDPGVIGHVIRLGGEQNEVAGVLPPGFRIVVPPNANFSSEVDIWEAQWLDPAEWPTRRNVVYRVLGRLAPEATFEAARAEMAAIATRIAATDSAYETAGYHIAVEPILQDVTGDAQPALVTLMLSVGLVLLVACGNVSTLVLVRTRNRGGELAIRAALGAGSGRLLRQSLTESLVLAFVGAAFGLLVALVGIPAFLAIAPNDVPRIDEVTVDATVLAFTVVAAFASALVFGTAPAWYAARTRLTRTLQEQRRGGAGGGNRVRQATIAAEVALSVILLVGAGLMLRTLNNLADIDPGFDPSDIVTFELVLGEYDQAGRHAFARQLRDGLSAIPGIEGVTAASPLPMDALRRNGRYGPEEALADETLYRQAIYRYVLPDFFDTLRTGLIEGRTFEAAAYAEPMPVVVVDDKLAKQTWPGESAVGKQLIIRMQTPEPTPVQVIGVVEHQRDGDLTADSRESIYFATGYPGFPGTMTWAVRSSLPLENTMSHVRRQVAELDRAIPVAKARRLDVVVRESTNATRFQAALIAVFAALAWTMACVGLYSVVANLVRQRRAEIGLRMALGAPRGSVVRLLLRQGLGAVGAGTGLGVLGALALTRLLGSMLVGVSTTDPATFLAAPALFAVVAFIAIAIPARRSARIDPVLALRGD